MQYGLIGEHLGHSYSREIHEQLADYRYELHELSPDALGPFLTARDFRAINVTIPYKQAVLPYLDEISATARRIGAVNTIVNRGGLLYGDNTDFAGLKALLERLGLCLQGKKVLILGTGGTSKTARAVAEAMGAGEILRVSRRTGEADTVTYAQALAAHTDAQILINTTPVGMYPQQDESPLCLDAFSRLEGVADAIYHPLRTNLVQQAQARGIPAAGGLYMLAAQAAAACAVFQGKAPSLSLAERAFSAVLREKQNIVLIGMPTSGKTTVGRRLAERSGRRFFDTDELLVERFGCPIADYFAQNGEAAFRKQEQALIAVLAGESGCVIATGGGAILREANLRYLRQNGLLFFLDRSPEKLLAAADRPLSSDRDALLQRYHERYDRYCAAADRRIDANGTVEAVVGAIEKELTV